MGKATTDHPALVGLTEKRRRFVLAYVGEAMGNASEAARIAGYAHPMQQGHDTLRNREVAEAIRALTKPDEDEAIASSERLHKQLSDIALGKVEEVERKASDMVAAAKLLLTARGELVKRVERVDQPKSRAELVAKLEETLAKLKEGA
jgi:phage terminase small subunit